MRKINVKIAQVNQPVKPKYIEKGVIGDDKGEGVWSTTYESRHTAHLEVPTEYTATSEKACKGFVEYLDECHQLTKTSNRNGVFLW